MFEFLKEIISPFFCLHCNKSIKGHSIFCFDCSYLLPAPKLTMFCTKCKTNACNHHKNKLIQATEYMGPGKDIIHLLVYKQKWSFDIILNLFKLAILLFEKDSKNILFIKENIISDTNELLAYKLSKILNTKHIKYTNQKNGLIFIPFISQHTKLPNETNLTIITSGCDLIY